MQSLLGIKQRHWADASQATSDLAYEACLLALKSRGYSPSEVERLILATVSPDYLTPSTACVLQHKLGAAPAPSHDITASCAGFLFALDVAVRCILTGARNALICASDVRSRWLNLADRSTCAIFGDGAAAALIEPCSKGTGILGIALASDGSGHQEVYVPAGGSAEGISAESLLQKRDKIHMTAGPQTYLKAVTGMLNAAQFICDAFGVSLHDVDCVVAHQANERALERVAKFGRFPLEKMVITFPYTGNTSGASVGIGLDHALRTGQVADGKLVLLVAAGAGHNVGAALVRWTSN